MKHRNPLEFTNWQVALLSYQSPGPVYGDIRTPPLYVFLSFTLPSPGEDILGILSLILWMLTMINLIEYVFVVLHADDHREDSLGSVDNQRTMDNGPSFRKIVVD
ncbi:hypothetical protein ACP70R_001157 [Stipagrostis hirtigluma subsp. patula]